MSSVSSHPDLDVLIDSIARILDERRTLTEYELIQALKKPPYGLFSEISLADSLMLFQCHFLVMHGLYQIQALWCETNKASVIISSTKIEVLPLRQSQAMSQATDHALRAYYLDLSQLDTTDSTDVDALLTSFWRRMAQGYSNDQHQDDIKALGLTLPISLKAARTAWRAIAQEHHPDKGGDGEEFARLSGAYQRVRARLTV